MLIKYLNDLDRAVQKARRHKDLDSISHCIQCVSVLQDYLQGQMEPIRRKGFEIMEHLLPSEFDEWTASWMATRGRPAVVSRLMGAL
ncbi:MAG: hypothetical protein CVV10_04875 [Gammaproteobacteria bacterium HGW-Gammaproteobacteria-14]|nr:MAG: hypothetical protein CVV10_04875 [Gammaproteobacteria bacterium HGW-Gammaproteobacteria-14]